MTIQLKRLVNVCENIIEPRPKYVLLPCAPRRKPDVCFPLDPDQEFDRRHGWGTDDGRCEHCGQSPGEVRVRLSPVTGERTRRRPLPHRIVPVDEPPIVFFGGEFA